MQKPPVAPPSNSLFLCLETSGETLAVGIGGNNSLLASTQLQLPRAHLQYVATVTQQLLEHLALSAGSLGGVAILAGPGSYTGLRVSTAFAKGFCFGQNLPLFAFNTLEVMAEAAGELLATPQATRLVPALDARRGAVFAAVYMLEPGQPLQETLPPAYYRPQEPKGLFAWLQHNAETAYAVGSGVAPLQQQFPRLGGRAQLPADTLLSVLAKRAAEAQTQHAAVDPDSFEPYYLKPVHTTRSKKNPFG
mgnify:CR=1 FL=1